MRGIILSHPAVAAVLSPYLVTWWEGHNERVPAGILEIESQARFQRTGNMQAYVLAPDGRVAGGFNPFPGQRPFDRDRGNPEEYFAAHVTEITNSMGLSPGAPASSRTIKLPDVDSPGVRLLLTFRGEMNAHVPVVEVTEVPPDAWQALAYPGEAPRAVDSARLISWLCKIYPPAMMDQANQVDRVSGQLELTPVPGEGNARRAVLHGRVELTLAASKAFTGHLADPRRKFRDLVIPGTISIVLDYGPGAGTPRAMRGWFQGTYSRPGPPHDRRPRPVSTLYAAIESRGLAGD